MTPSLQGELTQNDWSVGEVRDVAPTLISPVGAYGMTDVLLDEDGNPYRRGGTEYLSGAGLGAAGLTWTWSGFLLPGARTLVANSSDFGVLSADDSTIANLGGSGLSVPKQSAVLEDLLYIGGGTLYGGSRKTAVYSTGTVKVTQGSKTVTGSGTTWNTLVDAGMLFHIGTERVYVVASIDSTTQITLRDAYEGSSGEGKSYTLNPVWTVGSDPYDAFDYVTVCANRFVFASGRTIKFTDVRSGVINPHSFTNKLGTTNEHTVPQGVEINGLATVAQTVLVFTTAGVWTLDGLALDITDLNGNAQHRLQVLSTDIVLASAAGIASYNQQLVVPAGDGVYLMDGVSQPVRISKPIGRQYRQRIADGYRIGGAKVYRSHYLMPVITGSSKVKEVRVCRLDRPTRDRDQTIYPWSQLKGDGGKVACYAIRTTAAPQEPKLLGTQTSAPSRLMDCSGYFEPRASNKTDADGTWPDLDVISRAYPTGEDTLNVLRAIRARYELVDNGDEAKLAFSYNDGSAKGTGSKWGQMKWGQAKWGGSSGAWIPIGELGPSDGRDPGKLRVNKRFRHVRLRARSVGPAALCVLRSLELKTRPSGATRR